jgi:hypothetical protein
LNLYQNKNQYAKQLVGKAKKKMSSISYRSENLKKRWVAYFDLLGTTSLIATGNYSRVFSIYAKAIEQAKISSSNFSECSIQHICFSDSFLIFNSAGNDNDFALIDSVARWFAYFLITDRIPLRGAISFGTF